MTSHRQHLLLVEDNPGDARLIREMLRGTTEFDLECAEDLRTALARLGAGGIDLVLLDLGLPDSQGLSTLAAVLRHGQKVPIIVLTGQDSESLALEAVRTGAQDYLVKGHLDPGLLVRAIRYARERKGLEEERRAAQEELVLLGQLAGGVGHELRNPLGAIKNALYFLRMAIEAPSPDVTETFAILERELVTTEQIIGNLLDFARTPRACLQRIEVASSIKAALGRIWTPPGVEVEVTSDPELPEVFADGSQLVQVFCNLLTNAIQAMPEGGALRISMRAVESGRVDVTFSDTGIGIPPQDLPRIFEPLFTTKPKGIGLGLAISKILLERNGASIEAHSEVGKGTTFIVGLPCRMP